MIHCKIMQHEIWANVSSYFLYEAQHGYGATPVQGQRQERGVWGVPTACRSTAVPAAMAPLLILRGRAPQLGTGQDLPPWGALPAKRSHMPQHFTSKTSSDPRATIKEKIIFKKIKFTNLLLVVPQSFFLLLQPVPPALVSTHRCSSLSPKRATNDSWRGNNHSYRGN